MRKLLRFILILSIYSSILYSQSLMDSVNNKIESFKTVNEKVNFLNKASNQLRKAFRIKEALKLSNMAVDLVIENNLDELGSKSYSYLGLAYRDLSSYIEAKEAFTKAMEYATKLNQKTQIAYGYNNIATIERIMSNYAVATELIYKSLEAFKDIGHTKGIGNCYVNLGILYRYQKEYDKSFEYLNEAIKIRRELNDNYGIAQVLFLIAETHFMNGNNEECIEYYLRADEYYQKENVDKKHSKTTIYMGLGGAYYELGNYEKALEYRMAAAKVLNKDGDINSRSRVNLALGKIYTKLKKYKTAENYLNLGLKYAEEANLASRKLETLKAFSDLYEQWLKYDKGFYNLNKYVELKDSIYSGESKQRIESLALMHQAEEKEKENQILNAELELASQKTLLLTISFLAAIILLVLLYFYYLHTKKANSLLKEVNSVKDLYFSVISHDVKNPFGTIINSSELLLNSENELSSKEKSDLIKNINKSSKKVYELLENLLKWSQSQQGHLSIKKERLNLYEMINRSVELLNETADKKEIEIVNNVDDNLYVKADQNTLDSVIRNLVNNAIKYSDKRDKVIVKAEKNKDTVEVEVIDHGIGISEKQLEKIFKEESSVSTTGTEGEKGSGFGLILCKDFIEKNGGKISVARNEGKGSTFKFSLLSAE